VFTISAAYTAGTNLWRVPDQPVRGGTFDVARSIEGRLGAGMAATYYKGEHLGVTADVFIFELAYADACHVRGFPRPDSVAVLGCVNLDESEHSALAAVISVGGIFRVASRELVSPFARVGAGILISNQSSLLTSGLARLPGSSGPPSLVQIYNDNRKSRVGAALGLGVGFTTPISSGFQFRWELRDNIVGIQRVDGASPEGDFDPPHGIAFKHLFSVIAGVDLVLERQRGRRY
jgi:hypothetical protein